MTKIYPYLEKALAEYPEHFWKHPELLPALMQLTPVQLEALLDEWVGVRAELFFQCLNPAYVRDLLQKKQPSLFGEMNLSEPSFVHKGYERISLKMMRPDEYEMGGKKLFIQYNQFQSPFGKVLVANTSEGICHIAFVDELNPELFYLKQTFPAAMLLEETNPMQEQALLMFKDVNHPSIPVHVKGTDFQQKIWEALLDIPLGHLSTYQTIALQVGQPGASRAVGTAVGANPLAYLIPCHRVVRSTGESGGYRWGSGRKAIMIAWEAARIHKLNQC